MTAAAGPPLRDGDSGPARNRARGVLAASFELAGGRTRLNDLHEAGGYRLRLPAPPGPACEAVMVNTGGGVLGGDRVRLAFEARAGAHAVITGTAAEKIYRAQGEPARIDVALSLGSGARLDWLPQETILFEGAALARRVEVDMDVSATLLVAETAVFGRLAAGERSIAGRFTDDWRVRREGVLVFAEAQRLLGPIGAVLDGPALGGGARAVATVLHVAPDAESRLEGARAALETAGVAAGASAWNGFLVARLAGVSPQALRAAIVTLLHQLRGVSLPRVWQT